MNEENANNLKELGNAAVKNLKHEEAVLHYTHAIKLEPTNYILYSNRSYAFLKIQQYFFALEDANETIKLNPTGAKGYFRKAEVEFATFHFTDAIKSYEQALYYKPEDENIIDAIKRAKHENIKSIKANEQIPWLGAGVGIILGVVLVILDYLLAHKPTHPVLMAFVTISISMVGYGVAKTYCYYTTSQRKSLLEAPADLWKDEELSNEKDGKTKLKYSSKTKSQARQKYKKGKM